MAEEQVALGLGSSQSSDLDEEHLQELEKSARPVSTIRATDYGVRKFNDWLSKRNITCDFATVNVETLNGLLRKFYAEVKPTKQGGSLSASTLTCLRAAIHRYVTGAPFNRNFNIINDKEFLSSNKMFTARCKLYFKTGNRKPQHKPPIGDGDMKKLGQYFSRWRSCPQVLVESVWFFLCYYFGRRGREGWACMTTNTFAIDRDSEGHQFVFFKTTEITKNHQGGHRQSEIDYADQRMYGPGVDVFGFYISKLHPDNTRLFQTPVRTFKSNESIETSPWYKNEPMGKNTLSSMMPRISAKAGLSKSYTCHSVRASTVTILYQAGVATQSIISVTKHKNTSSLGHYIQDLSVQQKRDVSSILTSALEGASTGKLAQSMESPEVKSIFEDQENDSQAEINFDLGFDLTEETTEVQNNKDLEKESAGPTSSSVVDIPVTVYNVTLPASSNLPQETLCGSMTKPSSNSILTNATFHGCTINFQLKQ